MAKGYLIIHERTKPDEERTGWVQVRASSVKDAIELSGYVPKDDDDHLYVFHLAQVPQPSDHYVSRQIHPRHNWVHINDDGSNDG